METWDDSRERDFGIEDIGLRPLAACYHIQSEPAWVPGRWSSTRTATRLAERSVMFAWVVLIISGIFESVWATALGKSEGLSKAVPDIIFIVGLILSMAGLAYAMRDIPASTAYAVWVGIGAALTVIYAMLSGDETFSLLRMLLICGLVACVIGLKLAH